ncbi:DUF4381 domain-containing protein [Microbulbifer pacificus]|uniref:DUF4381 domain-containing protein n=1 Tax=Microbulbifer pacificus TaxID=407164 RepID=UPI000CF4FD27|nr:DUF4381 domain-containing protein [Microbulbifer pacificus]
MLPKQAAPAPTNPMTPEMQELLAQLRDIHEPAPIGWWPLASGWWILAGAVIALVFTGILFALHLRQKRRRNLYRSEGVRLLQALNLGTPRAIEEINILLKRVAVVTYGRKATGPLTGQRWIRFLETSSEVPMPEPARRAILENLYSGAEGDQQSLKDFREFAIDWVRKHQPTALPTAANKEMKKNEGAEVV